MMGRKELSGFDTYHSDKVIISEDFFRFLSEKKYIFWFLQLQPEAKDNLVIFRL